MKKQLKLKERETAATNSDFYNLFRPIAPSIDLIGKVAQVISGLTEAVTIWFITQSELSGASKTVSILISILAMILVVAILELGGRKFLQVLTRAIVWKRLRSAWYIALFAIVSAITIGMGVLSFNLSTNGVEYAFVSGVKLHETFDESALKQEYRKDLKEISDEFSKEMQLIKSNQKQVLAGTNDQFDSRIKANRQKAGEYLRKYNSGQKWALSHVEKHNKKAQDLDTEKSIALAALSKAHTKKLDNWQLRKNKVSRSEKTAFQNAVAKAERNMKNQHRNQYDTASFWGSLFSFFVGFSVILAFICIISMEVFRRGSGIQVEYEEEDQEIPVWQLVWDGFTNRFGGFFRSRAERFAQVSKPTPSSSTIGFSRPRPVLTNHANGSLPHAELEDGAL